jgi:hypothetical protein
MQTATGLWASKVLLTAVELHLFTVLDEGSLTADELGGVLELSARGRLDFFDALVALGFLGRDGDGPQGRYRNTPETGAFLNRKSPTYIGGMPEMLNSRLFGFWNHLGAALRTGQPQNEVKTHGKHIFEELYAHENKLYEFLSAMTGFQAGNFTMLAEKFAFDRLMSLNMLIEFGDAFDYTGADFREWCTEAGFKRFEIIPLAGPSSAAVAYK